MNISDGLNNKVNPVSNFNSAHKTEFMFSVFFLHYSFNHNIKSVNHDFPAILPGVSISINDLTLNMTCMCTL